MKYILSIIKTPECLVTAGPNFIKNKHSVTLSELVGNLFWNKSAHAFAIHGLYS